MYIAENWTHELLQLMIDKLIKRKTPEGQAPVKEVHNDKVVSDKDLFRGLGKKLKYQGK